jgi:hypothetical protein
MDKILMSGYIKNRTCTSSAAEPLGASLQRVVDIRLWIRPTSHLTVPRTKPAWAAASDNHTPMMSGISETYYGAMLHVHTQPSVGVVRGSDNHLFVATHKAWLLR